MPIRLDIDDDLLAAAQEVAGQRSKADVVNEALREYIQRHRQPNITDLFGKVTFDPSYDYKKQRRRQ